MNYQFDEEVGIKQGDVVKRNNGLCKLYIVGRNGDNAYYLIDLSNGEIEDFGTYSITSLIEKAKLKLVCRNENLYITNK